MARTSRLRLTLGHLAVLVGVVGLVFYASLLHAHATAVPLVRSAPHAMHARLVAVDPSMGVPWLVAGDLGVVLLGALGAYVLAGPPSTPSCRPRRGKSAARLRHRTSRARPLTVLLGTLEAALLRRRGPEEHEDVLRQVQGEAEHRTILLDDVLALAHAESGAETRAADPLDLHAVARATAAEMAARGAHDTKRHLLGLRSQLRAALGPPRTAVP